MEIARTLLTHARAPHFLWPYAVRYAAHQLNLWPRVSRPEVLPTGLWTRSPGVASRFHVWGCLALVRDTSADKLSPRAVPCVFFGFPEESSDFTFYYPPSHRFFGSRYVRFEEFVPYYVRYPCRDGGILLQYDRTIRAELLTIGQEVHMATFAAHVLKGLPLDYGFLRRKLDISSPDMMVERVCSEVLIEEQTLSIEQSYRQITSDASAIAGAVNTIVATTGVNGKEGKGGREQTDKKKDGKWEKKRAPLKGRCYNCNEEGHMAAKCPNKKKDTTSVAAANVAEGDGKGVSLTVACSAAKLLADNKDLWFLDSRCSQHMTDRKEWFTVIRDPSATKSVKGFDGSMQNVAGAGEVLLEGTNGLHVTLHDVLFVPGMKANLVSHGQLLDKGAKLQTEEGVTRIIASGGQVAATARYRHRLHYLDLKPGPARNGATAAAACNGTAAEAACTNMAGGAASNGTGAATACNGTAAAVACTNLAGGAASNGTTAAAACNGRAAAAACNGRAAAAACKGTVVAAICNNTAATAACNGTAAEVAGNGMPKIFAEVVSSALEENDEAASLTTYAVGIEAMLNLRHTHLENDHAGAVQWTATDSVMLGMDVEKGGEDTLSASSQEAKLTRQTLPLPDVREGEVLGMVHGPEQNQPPSRTVIIIPVPSMQGGDQSFDRLVDPLGSNATMAPPALCPSLAAGLAPLGPEVGPSAYERRAANEDKEGEAADLKSAATHGKDPIPTVPPL
ncbi:unnamed protein product [Closterium sp. NIES-65]|nr:unnamed protein product [Closterium sp. NIES-65]